MTNNNAKFFTECLWWKRNDHSKYWLKGQSLVLHHDRYVLKLPDIENSLDLQEEYMWPLLEDRGLIDSGFQRVENDFFCYLYTDANGGDFSNKGVGETKAIAQFAAGMKALGKEV